MQKQGLALYMVRQTLDALGYKQKMRCFGDWKMKVKMFEWRMNQSVALQTNGADSKLNTQKMKEILN